MNAPFFGSLDENVIREAKRTILDYESRVKNHNTIHGLDNQPLQVLFMLRKGLGRTLVEELLMPDDKYDPTDKRQQTCVRDYFFRKTGTPGISTHIEIDAFERGMRDLKMDVRDKSWVSRTTTFLSKITLLLEDTRVQLEAKKLIRKCMRGVMPFSLKQRINTLMESGNDSERAAAKDLKVWKALLRKEARLDWESAIRLKQIQTPDFKSRNFRHGTQRHQRFSFKNRNRSKPFQSYVFSGQSKNRRSKTHSGSYSRPSKNINFQRKPFKKNYDTKKQFKPRRPRQCPARTAAEK